MLCRNIFLSEPRCRNPGARYREWNRSSVFASFPFFLLIRSMHAHYNYKVYNNHFYNQYYFYYLLRLAHNLAPSRLDGKGSYFLSLFPACYSPHLDSFDILFLVLLIAAAAFWILIFNECLERVLIWQIEYSRKGMC